MKVHRSWTSYKPVLMAFLNFILGLQVPEYMDGSVIDILEKNEEGAKTDLGSAFVQTVQNNAHQT